MVISQNFVAFSEYMNFKIKVEQKNRERRQALAQRQQLRQQQLPVPLNEVSRFSKYYSLCFMNHIFTDAMQCNAMQCNAMQCNAMQCN